MSALTGAVSGLRRWKEEKLGVQITAGGTTHKSDTHKIECVKGKVAFDLEWNRKIRTFDREALPSPV